MQKLPTDVVRLIYLRMYFPWVMEELLMKQPQNNEFIVRASRSSMPITEMETPLGIFYLTASQSSRFYRRNVPPNPSAMCEAWTSDISNPYEGGFVSPWVRGILDRSRFGVN